MTAKTARQHFSQLLKQVMASAPMRFQMTANNQFQVGALTFSSIEEVVVYLEAVLSQQKFAARTKLAI